MAKSVFNLRQWSKTSTVQFLREENKIEFRLVYQETKLHSIFRILMSCIHLDLLLQVGLPAKSGVSGSLVLVVPGVMGIGLWSPPLDNLGNTVRQEFLRIFFCFILIFLFRGVAFAEKFVNLFNFHRFDNLVYLRSKVDPRKHRLVLMFPWDTCLQFIKKFVRRMWRMHIKNVGMWKFHQKYKNFLY